MEKLKDNIKEPLISIIIPVYCVEKYLAKCVGSVCDSEYKNLEIILVDDGSTDSSGLICDELAAKDKRIRVIHSDNYGQSHARNLALDIAKGIYIGFVDSDDWIHSDMYSEMVKIATSQNADIVECNFNGRRSDVPDEMDENVLVKMSGVEAIKRQLDYRISSRFPSTSVWSKLFHRDILQGLKFPEGRIHEEFSFLCQAFCKAKKYVYINKKLYEHILRDGSTTVQKVSVKLLDKLYVYQERNEYLRNQNNKELYLLSKEQEYELLLFLAGEMAKNYLFDEEIQVRNLILNQKQDILKSGISTSKKRQYRIFFLSYHLYYGLRNIKTILRHPREFVIKNIQKEFTIYNVLGMRNREKYYVIRCNQPKCGLFAIFMFVLDHMAYAHDKGYIPILKMEKYDCLYKENKRINGTKNPWEYYFKPISKITLMDRLRAKSITYGSVNFIRYKGIYYFAEKRKNVLPDKERVSELFGLVSQYIHFQPELQRELDNWYSEMKRKYNRILGIHVRGTDMYVAGKQHNKPSSKLVDLTLIQDTMKKNNMDGVFLCTDDVNVVNKFQKFFGEKLFVTNSVRQVEGKREGIHFDKSLGNGRGNHRYLLGKEVIIDMYLLSKCNVLMCGPSNVAFAAIIYNNNAYEDILFYV